MQSTAHCNNITDGQEHSGRAGKAVVPNCGFCETRVLICERIVEGPLVVGGTIPPPPVKMAGRTMWSFRRGQGERGYEARARRCMYRTDGRARERRCMRGHVCVHAGMRAGPVCAHA